MINFFFSISICFFCMVSIFSPEVFSKENEPVKVHAYLRQISDNVAVRELPSNVSKTTYSLRWGDDVQLIGIWGKWGNWAKMKFYKEFDTDNYIIGWIYSAFFDPCMDNYSKVEPYVDKTFVLFNSCIHPTIESKKEFRKLILDFNRAYRKNDVRFIKKHSLEEIYYSDHSIGGNIGIILSDELLSQFKKHDQILFHYTPFWLSVDIFTENFYRSCLTPLSL